MNSKYKEDSSNENILHYLMIKNGLQNLLQKKGFFYERDAINKNEQKSGIDFICKYKDTFVNIDEKTRFTIPIYENIINYTFSLELLNGNSGNIGWFIDKNKKTDYYLLNYPILSGEIGNNNRGYLINKDYSIDIITKNGINKSNIKIIGVMSQLVSVEKLRNFLKNKINKEDLINFLNNKKNNNFVSKKLYNLDFTEIKPNEKGKFTYKEKGNMYILCTPSNILKECPINLILNQSIYSKLREFEIFIPFKKELD